MVYLAQFAGGKFIDDNDNEKQKRGFPPLTRALALSIYYLHVFGLVFGALTNDNNVLFRFLRIQCLIS